MVGAEIGGLVAASLATVESVVVPGPEAVVLTAPTPALVYSGIGLRKASRKAGVPNVSGKAIPRTWFCQIHAHFRFIYTLEDDLLLRQSTQASILGPVRWRFRSHW